MEWAGSPGRGTAV